MGGGRRERSSFSFRNGRSTMGEKEWVLVLEMGRGEVFIFGSESGNGEDFCFWLCYFGLLRGCFLIAWR